MRPALRDGEPFQWVGSLWVVSHNCAHQRRSHFRSQLHWVAFAAVFKCVYLLVYILQQVSVIHVSIFNNRCVDLFKAKLSRSAFPFIMQPKLQLLIFRIKISESLFYKFEFANYFSFLLQITLGGCKLSESCLFLVWQSKKQELRKIMMCR